MPFISLGRVLYSTEARHSGVLRLVAIKIITEEIENAKVCDKIKNEGQSGLVYPKLT